MSRPPKRRRLRFAIGLVWVAILGGLGLGVWQAGLTVREIVELLYSYVRLNPIAPVIYILIYALRPLTFFPAMWLTIAGGSLFGFIPGLIYGLLGENTSAQTAYFLARFYGTDIDGEGHSDRNPRIAAFRRRLVNQSFPTVLILRASYLPFDLVNYACGLLRVPWVAYTAGSVIGMLPPMVTYVSFGATVSLPNILKHDEFSPGQLIDTTQLIISGCLIVVSLIIAFIAHRRRDRLEAEEQEKRHD